MEGRGEGTWARKPEQVSKPITMKWSLYVISEISFFYISMTHRVELCGWDAEGSSCY